MVNNRACPLRIGITDFIIMSGYGFIVLLLIRYCDLLINAKVFTWTSPGHARYAKTF